MAYKGIDLTNFENVMNKKHMTFPDLFFKLFKKKKNKPHTVFTTRHE